MASSLRTSQDKTLGSGYNLEESPNNSSKYSSPVSLTATCSYSHGMSPLAYLLEDVARRGHVTSKAVEIGHRTKHARMSRTAEVTFTFGRQNL